ncbi:MAG: hypothetical protein WCC66_09735 [Rhizobiaceae bacterium]
MRSLFHFEHHKQPVATARHFRSRVLRNVSVGLAVIAVALGVGMAGYTRYEGMSPLDAYANAAMILSGMGPLTPLKTDAGKFFAGTYAIVCGLLIFGVAGLVFAPVFHRVLHRFHVEDGEGR